jgi:conjugal transfer pilus assembly protein TraF
MAPVINSVAKRHGLHLQGVSIDGGKLEFFDKVHPDNGLSQKFNVTMVPALFAVNPLSGDFFPIATGSISEQEIEERILQIAEFQAYQGQEGSKHAQ